MDEQTAASDTATSETAVNEQAASKPIASETDPPQPELLRSVIVVPPGGLSFAAPDGRPLLSLCETIESGEHQVQLCLHSPAGLPKVILLASALGSAVHFLPNAMEPRLSIGAVVDSTFFAAANPNGTAAVSITSGETGGAATVYDGEGNFGGAISNAPRLSKAAEQAQKLSMYLSMPKLLD